MKKSGSQGFIKCMNMVWIFLMVWFLAACGLDGDTGNKIVDYMAQALIFPDGSAVNSGFSGTFYIANSTAGAGSSVISWTVYISTDDVYQEGDVLADTGVVSALAGNGVSAQISYSGTWPDSAGGYYLLLIISASDDGNNANNLYASPLITVTEAKRVDYIISGPVFPLAGAPNGVFNGSFKIQNAGELDGAENVTWTVYSSSDNVLSPGLDTVVQTSTQTGMAAGAVSPVIPFSGTWPGVSGSYYLFIVIYSTDDSNTDNNGEVSAAIVLTQPPGVDYAIVSEIFPASGIIGTSYEGSFRIQNLGAANGAYAVGWNVYISDDNIYDGGDTQVGAGALPSPLPASGISAVINFSGSWPGTAGTYYLIIRISAADDTDNTSNNELISGPIAVSEIVDYSIIDANFPESGSLGGPFGGNFRITNTGTINGNQQIEWNVYLSANAVFDGGDSSISSGTQAALSASTSTGIIGFSGTWPSAAGSYYLIIVISANDDFEDTNNIEISSAIGVIDSGRFVTAGQNGMIKYSDDGGVSWNSAVVSPSTTYDFARIATNGAGTWVAVGALDDALLLYYSIDDGLNWQPGVLGSGITSNNDLYDISYHDGRWLAAGEYNIGHVIVLYSNDAVNWQQGSGYASYGIRALTYDDTYNRWYGSNTGNSYGVICENGMDFTAVLGGGTGGFYCVEDDNGTTVTRLIGGTQDNIKYSDNGGSSWTSATTFTADTTIRGIAWDGSYTWVAVGSSYSTIVYSSDAGENWISASSFDSSESYYDVVYDPKSARFVAVGDDGLISYSSDGGYSWTKSANTGTTTLAFNGIDVGP